MINDKYMDLLERDKKEPYIQYKENRLHEFPYGSHQPVLIHMINTITEGAVLEIGIGNYSTPILNLICGKQNRELLSVETDPRWVDTMIGYKRKGHEIRYVDRDELIKFKDPLFKRKYAIAFIDSPVAGDRQPIIEKINADYIIVHDTDSVVTKVKDDFNYDFKKFKHVYHFSLCTPMTSVLSNLEKIDKKILTVFEKR